MFKHWRALPFLLVGSLISSVSASQSFENTALVRTVELGGSLVHVTTTYAIKALETRAKFYSIALTPDEKEKTSWLEVKVKGEQTPLAVKDIGYDAPSKAHFFGIELPQTLPVNGTLSLVLETVQTHATHPWPERATQSDPQSLKYETSLFVLSPYRTAVQRTKIRAPSPKIISFTTPEGLEDFTLEDHTTKSGATLTYGPYNNIEPSSNGDFVDKYQKSVVIQYNYDYPLLEVTKLKRSAEVSHWGANLNIQDEIHLHNAGPALKGQFSRLEHQTQNFYNRLAPHILQSLALHLPAGIRDAYYYDLIGNVSTSHLRVAPSVLKKGAMNQYSILELRPRYPLMGGWNYSFTLGWDAPLADSVSWDKKNGRYIIGVPIMTPIPGAVVDEAEVKIILPEGATDVQIFPPFPAVQHSLSTHVTYLDTTGRPAVTFQYEQLTDKHAQFIYLAYKVPFSAHLKKPFAVATAFISLFVLALGGRRIDLRLHKK